MRVSNPGRCSIFLFSIIVHTGSCNPPIILFSGYRISLPGLKRPGCDIDHTLPSSAEVKNGWNYTSTVPVYRHVGSTDNILIARQESDIILVVR